MDARSELLGALLDSELRESVAEDQVRSGTHVAAIVGKERSALAAGPRASSFESSKHPRGASGSGQGGKFIAKGSSGAPVRAVQKHLGLQQTGSFAFDTEAAVQNFQRAHGLAVDGVVGAQTAQALLGNRNAKAVTPGALSSADARALGVRSGNAKHKQLAPVRMSGGIVV